MQKEGKAQKRSLKDILETRRSRNLKKKKKKKKKLQGEVKIQVISQKYIFERILLQSSCRVTQTNCYTCIFQKFCLYFQNSFFQLSVVASESMQRKRVFPRKLISTTPKNKFQFSVVLVKIVGRSDIFRKSKKWGGQFIKRECQIFLKKFKNLGNGKGVLKNNVYVEVMKTTLF